MATQQFVTQPRLTRQNGNMNIQRGPMPSDQTAVFKIGALTKIVSGLVVVSVTADTIIWGQAAGKTPLTADKPPVVIPAHPTVANPAWVFDLSNGAELIMNVGAISGTALVIGASAKLTSDVTIGAQYGLAVPTTGTYAGVCVLDPTNTTQKLFTVVALIDDNTYYNGRVRVRVLDTAIQ
jgi:hypothetical protein